MARIEISILPVALTWVLGFAGSVVVTTSCVVQDGEHCRHRNGDEACSGSTPYCNECLASNQNAGCVAQEPDAGCYFGGDSPFAAGTATDADTQPETSTTQAASDGSSGAPAECTAEGLRDGACPATAPLCSGGACVDCETAGDAFCSALDTGTPVCGESGDCVQCTADDTTVCMGADVNFFCGPDGACSGCFEHAQCGDSGCDLYTGECLDASVFWVEGPPCAEGADTGDGTVEDPFCSLAKLRDALGDRSTVHIMGSGNFDDSALVAASDGDVLVLLGEGGKPTLTVVQSAGGGRMYTQNLRLEADGASIVGCNTGGKLWLRDTDLIGNNSGFGMVATSNCEVTIERGIVARNDGGGIRTLGATLTLKSMAVMANGEEMMQTSGLQLENTVARASHVTVIANEGLANISCSDETELDVRNSIVMRLDGDSLSNCELATFHGVALDAEDYEDSDNRVLFVDYAASFFVEPDNEDPRLKVHDPFLDLALWAPGDPRVDIDGESLETVVGAMNYAGADQRP